MKYSELKRKSQEELQEILAQNKAKLQESKFKVASGQLQNVRDIRKIKKDIAKILTVLNNTQDVKA